MDFSTNSTFHFFFTNVKCVAYTWHITISFHVPMPFGLFATILGWEGHLEPEATYRDTRDGKMRLAYLV